MRIIARKTLQAFWQKEPSAEGALRAWFDEAKKASWSSPQQLKLYYRNASIISDKRVVFNIHGNSYRLIVDIEYRLKIVFIVWLGTHKDYDGIDVKEVKYVATDTNKKRPRDSARKSV